MRLLNVDSRDLETFPGADCPPYAILSHTWAEHEVSFSDIKSSKAKTKDAYRKIEYTCRQATKQKLKFCWIDTCCIDKSSSAELSEAINSMFAWYSNARVCYAYLEDVGGSTVDAGLPKAKWFTRGWTLQELLAPRRVEFYDRDWAPLGFKDTESVKITEFMHKLASITGVDELVLWKPTCIRVKSVAARMSWASNRITTRPEDIAYCLLGLFDVNMPLLYGEGDRAYIRLQEEIIRISDDHSIFAWDRDPGETSTVSCLASSPSWFRRGAYVVPFGRKQTESNPYTITNQGLQIQLPLLQKLESKVIFGLINCHWENNLFGCIGIPLQGTFDSQFFERSSHHRPETITLSEMSLATKRTIFLSTRPPVELPFAAEVNLQVFDSSLKALGFSNLEIANNPLASHHWHPTCKSFRLRWPSTSTATKEESVCLLWILASHPELGFAIYIRGKIDEQWNGGLGRFHALSIGMSTIQLSSSLVERLDKESFKSGNVENPSEGDRGLSISVKCTLTIPQENSKALSVELSAELRQEDIFGNEVYKLALSGVKK
jgi:hypothetical protein